MVCVCCSCHTCLIGNPVPKGTDDLCEAHFQFDSNLCTPIECTGGSLYSKCTDIQTYTITKSTIQQGVCVCARSGVARGYRAESAYVCTRRGVSVCVCWSSYSSSSSSRRIPVLSDRPLSTDRTFGTVPRTMLTPSSRIHSHTQTRTHTIHHRTPIRVWLVVRAHALPPELALARTYVCERVSTPTGYRPMPSRRNHTRAADAARCLCTHARSHALARVCVVP